MPTRLNIRSRLPRKLAHLFSRSAAHAVSDISNPNATNRTNTRTSIADPSTQSSTQSALPAGGQKNVNNVVANDAAKNDVLSAGEYVAILANAANSQPTGGIMNLVKSGYEGLKTTLRLLERATDALPPLKSVAGGLLAVIDIVESTTQNTEDLNDLQRKLYVVVSIIEKHMHSKEYSASYIRRLEGLSIAIHHQISAVKTRKERSLSLRVTKAYGDVSDITRVYRTLSFLFHVFTIDTTLATEEITQKILSYTMLDKLCRVSSAAYDAFSVTHRHGCTEKTRESILAQLISWAVDPADTKIYWLNGMAGTGKTTITYTFCEILDRFQMLGATFFCSRLEGPTRNVGYIFPTIAYQLAIRMPSVCRCLLKVLERDPDIAGRSIQKQFEDIIVEPLLAASEELARKPLIISIEALDECSDSDDVDRLLTIISRYSSTLPIKFFITSRPEQHIRQDFNRKNFPVHSKFFLHDVEKDVVNADIELFTRARLMEIADGRSDCLGSLDDWPPERELKTLVRLAGNLFIYAATACSFIGGGGNIWMRLSLVTTDFSLANGETAALDTLYNSIITAAYNNAIKTEQESIKLMLRAVVNAQAPLSMNGHSMLLGINVQSVRSALSALHSVVYIPSSGNMNDPISTLHASFPDYISLKSRAAENCLEPLQSHEILALRCLIVMRTSLVENICQLMFDVPNDKVPSANINGCISEGLAYACTYWASHIVQTSVEDIKISNLYGELLDFFDCYILKWIECTSLIGQLGTVV